MHGVTRACGLLAIGMTSLLWADPGALQSALKDLDHSVRPGDDFFRYANGTWLKTTDIPADRGAYGTAAVVADRTRRRTLALVQDAQKAPVGREARKVGDYYASLMDAARIEQQGLRPLQPQLTRIAAIGNRQQLAQELGRTLRADVDALNNTQFHTRNIFGLWVAQDLDDPTRYAPFLLQGGLGMPDRDYYLDPAPAMAQIRARYQTHILAVLRLAGIAGAELKAGQVYNLEHDIAEVHWSRADSEQVTKADNHWTVRDLEARAPGLDWASYLTAAGLERQSRFILWQPSAIVGIAALVGRAPLETWKAFLTFHALEHAASRLPHAFVDEQFAFYGQALAGTPQQRPSWKRALDATSEALGEAIGKLYVERYFSPTEKARAQAMVSNLLAAFGERIDRLSWMSPATKAKAKAKLASLKVFVGYPDRWRDYSSLQVVRGDAFGNAERAELFEYHHNLDKLGKPVDRTEWVVTPQTVNAFNLPAMNTVNISAAILQPPYFDSARPVVMDYGAIGATIMGHEISHSFDDQGALFDARGRLSNWWTPEDFAHFRASTAKLAAQFDSYRPFPDAHVDGRQTLSENVADVAGVASALDAYRRATNGISDANRTGELSSDQLFFIAVAQTWREKLREPAMRARLVTDEHAPTEYRADTARNIDAWYAAFDIQPGQALYLSPSERVRIW